MIILFIVLWLGWAALLVQHCTNCLRPSWSVLLSIKGWRWWYMWEWRWNASSARSCRTTCCWWESLNVLFITQLAYSSYPLIRSISSWSFYAFMCLLKFLLTVYLRNLLLLDTWCITFSPVQILGKNC